MGVYVYRNEQVEGPFDELVLQQALMNGTMASDELCCREGSEEWISASAFFARISPLPTMLAKPLVPALSPVQRSVFLPLRNFWSRLSKGQVVALSVLATVFGLPIALIVLANMVASTGPVPIQASTQSQVETIDEQINRVDERQNELGIQLISIMAEIAQANQNGQTLSPQGAGRLTEIFLHMTQESENLKRRKQSLIDQKTKTSSLK